MEAVKQGSAAVGLRSDEYAVLVALNVTIFIISSNNLTYWLIHFEIQRSSNELASYQKKLIRIDDHMGIAIAGLTSDARVLRWPLICAYTLFHYSLPFCLFSVYFSTFMRTEAMKSKMIMNRPLPVSRIATALGDKAQVNTQRYGRRPYGVGLLIIGYDVRCAVLNIYMFIF
jgi:20S proteasome subunit alpha 6